jgi:hypothetical protein
MKGDKPTAKEDNPKKKTNEKHNIASFNPKRRRVILKVNIYF